MACRATICRTKILDGYELDSIRILLSRGGIHFHREFGPRGLSMNLNKT